MIEVEMMKDIRKYKAKFIGPFTKRQMICILISLVYEIPFLVFFKFIDIETRIILAAVLFLPMYFCGWQEKYGMPYEIYVTRRIYRLFLVPQHRIYKNTNLYRPFMETIQKKKIKELEKEKNKSKHKKKSKEPLPMEFVAYK